MEGLAQDQEDQDSADQAQDQGDQDSGDLDQGKGAQVDLDSVALALVDLGRGKGVQDHSEDQEDQDQADWVGQDSEGQDRDLGNKDQAGQGDLKGVQADHGWALVGLKVGQEDQADHGWVLVGLRVGQEGLGTNQTKLRRPMLKTMYRN